MSRRRGDEEGQRGEKLGADRNACASVSGRSVRSERNDGRDRKQGGDEALQWRKL